MTSIITFHLYFLKAIVLVLFKSLFGKSNRDARSEKMKAKYMKEDVIIVSS